MSQPNGGLYFQKDGTYRHGNGREIEENPFPGQPTMSEQQYREFCEYVLQEIDRPPTTVSGCQG